MQRHTGSTSHYSSMANTYPNNPDTDLLNRFLRLRMTAAELGIETEFALYRDSVERNDPDPHLREILESVVREIEATVLSGGFVTPHEGAGLECAGNHVLNTESGERVEMDFGSGAGQEHHVSVVGASGSGKSALQAQIAIEAARSHRTFIIDVNRYFRNIPAIVDSHSIFRWEHLRLNLFDAPADVAVNQFDQAMVGELASAFGLQFSEYEIHTAARSLREKGALNLVSLLDALQNTKVAGWSNRRRYLDSAVLIISNLIHATGELFRCESGMPLDQLLAGNVVLELDGLLLKHRAFLTRYFFEYLHLCSLSRGVS